MDNRVALRSKRRCRRDELAAMFVLAGHSEARHGVVSDELVDDLVLVGSEAQVMSGVQRSLRSGCDEIFVTLLPGTDADVDRTLRTLGSAP